MNPPRASASGFSVRPGACGYPAAQNPLATPSAGRTGVVSGVGELRDRIWQAITAWEQACSEVDVMLRAAEVDAAIDALVAGTPRPLAHEAVAAMEAG